MHNLSHSQSSSSIDTSSYGPATLDFGSVKAKKRILTRMDMVEIEESQADQEEMDRLIHECYI